MSVNLNTLITESRNQASEQIDTLSVSQILKIMNDEDKKVAMAVEAILPEIARTVEIITQAFSRGGRLIYSGAGTSGRLGILDASECTPTFGTTPGQVIGVIAGGQPAMLRAVENAEDNREQGAQDLRDLNFSSRDILVGISASGRTPYVLGAIGWAKQKAAITVALSCNPRGTIARQADIALTPMVGAEVITGSSRMKAGTAQKMVLNMLTTAAMIRSGKVFGNLMVNVEATNQKLEQRQIQIVIQATECDEATARQALEQASRHCKTAIVMILASLNAAEARALLASHQGFIRQALAER